MDYWVYLGVRTCDVSFLSLARTGVWLLFNSLWALLLSLLYVIREFNRFIHRGWAHCLCWYEGLTFNVFDMNCPSCFLSLQVSVVIGQFRYFKIELTTIDLIARLQGINPTNTEFYSLEPRTEVHCLQLKLAYYNRNLKFYSQGVWGWFSIYVNSQVKEMMGNIRKAFREEVADLMWIDDETRPKIFEKVNRTWRSFSVPGRKEFDCI